MATALACALIWIWTGDFEWPGAALVDAQELTSLDHGQRQRAAERLSLRGGPHAQAQTRAGLIALLDDPAPLVRVTAGRILARQGAAEAIDSATRWTISATPANRRLGLDVLRECPGPFPPSALRAVERSLTDADASVRLLAIDALSRQKDLKASLLPIAAASEDDNREVRLRAIRLLAAARDRRAVVPLLARLADVDRQARVEAIAALAAIGDLRAATALKRQLADAADDVRMAAALALGKLKIADAVPAIAALARRRSADEVSRQAALALGDIGTPEAIDALLGRLREPPPADEVAAGLFRAGDAGIPALIAEALRGTSSSSAAAATLLGQLRAGSGGSDRRVTAALTELVDRRGAATRAALGALAAIRDPEALPTLLAAAADPLPEIRRACYQTLIAIGDDRALAILERGLGDRDPQARALALRMGAGLGAATPTALAAMATRLRDPDAGVNHEAAASLLRLGRRVPGAVPPLLALLARAPGDSVIADALELMATPGDDRTLAAAAFQLPPDGRRAVARALAAAHAVEPLGDGPLIDMLLGMLSEDGANAEAAADALANAVAPRGREAAMLRAFAAAEPDVRPRLCPALAALAGVAGRDRLAALIADETQRADLRAAALSALVPASVAASALAVAPSPSPGRQKAWDESREPPRDQRRDPGRETPARMAALRALLTRATSSPEPVVAINARAAQAALAAAEASTRSALSRGHWVGVRLVASDGAPLAHEWVALTASSGTEVWARSGLDGVARLAGLAPGPYQVRVVNPDLTTRALEAASDRGP